MNQLTVFFGLVSYIIIGFMVLLLFNFNKGKSTLEILPYSFGLGLGLVSFQMFVYSLFRVPFSIYFILMPWLILLIFLLPRLKKIKLKFVFPQMRLYQWILIGLIFLCLTFTFFEANIRPLYAWDGIASWVLKGKMFFIDGFVNPQVYAILPDNYAYIVNLSVTYLYKLIGAVDDRSIQILFYSFYFFLGLSFYSQVRKITNRTVSLIFTFLLLSTQSLIRHGGRFEAGYADLALGFYIFLTTSLFINYLKKESLGNLSILSFFIFITSLIKEEGMFFIFLILIPVLYVVIASGRKGRLFSPALSSATEGRGFRGLENKEIKKKDFAKIVILVASIVPLFIWQLFKFLNGISFHYLYSNFNFRFDRTAEILKYMFLEFLNIQNWNLLWIVFFLAFVLAVFYKKISKIYLLIFIQLFFFFTVFLISPSPAAGHVSGVIDRLLLHLSPLAVYVTVISIMFKKEDKIIF